MVAGRFDPAFLGLPRELLVTTLRHHQKSFTVERAAELMPVFLSVANTDVDEAGHGRLALFLEGGYDLHAIEESVHAMVTALGGERYELA